MKSKIVFGAGFLAALILFSSSLPLPRRAEKPSYLCVWENGEETYETFSSAYPDLLKGEEGEIVLFRGGMEGRIEDEEYRRAAEALESEELAVLLSLSASSVSPLGRAALFKRFSDRGYYSEEFFRFDGERIVRAEEGFFQTAVLLTGDFPKGVLARTKTERLKICSGCELSAKGLIGSDVKEVEASGPYFVSGGGIYLRAAGKVRLIAALPGVRSLTVECDYLDEGALAPCKKLESLRLPAHYSGGLSRLFGDEIPETLVYEEIF